MEEKHIELGGLRAISVGEPADAAFVLVMLHGFMMVPGDLAPFARSIGLPGWFLYPEGPVAARSGRAWWHIDPDARDAALARGPRDFAVQDPSDLPAARGYLSAFLDAVVVAAPGRPLIVGGFSQGGMLVCDTLLRAERRVDGLVLFSTSRIAFSAWGPHLASGCFRDIPVLLSHGAADADLAFSAGEALRDALTGAGAQVEWVPFPEGHEIPLVVWRRLRKFLQANANAKPGVEGGAGRAGL
jgi:phospholipase/carboxylesterase